LRFSISGRSLIITSVVALSAIVCATLMVSDRRAGISRIILRPTGVS
jgi:hypothetical protein